MSTEHPTIPKEPTFLKGTLGFDSPQLLATSDPVVPLFYEDSEDANLAVLWSIEGKVSKCTQWVVKNSILYHSYLHPTTE